MNSGNTGTTGAFNFGSTGNTGATAGSSSAFSFGKSNTTTGFGAQANASTGATGGFGAGTNNTTSSSGGFSFSANNTTSSFGTGTNTSTTSGLGTGTNTTTGGFGSGTNNSTTGTFGLGSNNKGTSGFGFGNGTNSSTTGAFSSGTNNSTSGSGGFSFGNNNTTSGFGTGTNTSTTSGFGTGTNTTTGFGFGSGTNNSTTGGFGFGSNNKTNSGFGFGSGGLSTGGFGFGSGTNSTFGANNTAPQTTPVQNLSDNKVLLKQMGELVGNLDASLQTEVAGIISRIDKQQRMIDEIGVLDPSSTQDGLDTLKELQYECEKLKASQEVFNVRLQSLQSNYLRYEASLRHAQQMNKGEEGDDEVRSSIYRLQRRIPSVFFEDLLKQLDEAITRLTTKIENMEVMLSVNQGDGVATSDSAAVTKELNEVEKLMDIMTREYNAFVVQSAAVADLVKKMDIVKKKFIEIRNKEIEQRRKNLTLMAGMTDILANVIDDPFKECKDKSSCV